MTDLEMWGGLECTLNRVQDRFIDQSQKSGHNQRLQDLELFSELGIKKLRYPCLWELVAAQGEGQYNWSYLDERLGKIRELGMTPIAGFLHHGSGPVFTDLLDPEFPQKLAHYSGAFAQRYPWVKHYTPINEILTTARFSALYGHWYPHHKNNESFLKALFHQVKATILAMRAIREFSPEAQLIQTDDLGRAQGTEILEDQVEFENERRWLSWDLLCGKLTPEHPLFSFLLKNKFKLEDLQWIHDHHISPDVIGINHYPLSNRFLDHRLELYPSWSHGGNEKIAYADVGAVDTGGASIPTPESLLLEAWERYRIPLAITEVHCRGYREGQMRWMHQLWNAALTAKEQGAQVLGVTAWSLLGSYDWHNLCTKCEMFYEPGVFDLRSGTPRPTGLVNLIKELASSGKSHNPLFENQDFWQKSRRIQFAPELFTASLKPQLLLRPLLLLDSGELINQSVASICEERHIPFKLIGLDDPRKVQDILRETRPWAVIQLSFTESWAQASFDQDLPFLTLGFSEVLHHHPEALVVIPTSPLDPSLLHACLDLLVDGETGFVHLSEAGAILAPQSPPPFIYQLETNL